MRGGYWTGFLMGGLVGMLAAQIYGDRLMDTFLPGVAEDGGSEPTPRPYRRRRLHRRRL